MANYFFFGGERVGNIATKSDIEESVQGLMGLDVLKNAMIPVITFLGMALADILAGSIVIEQVFNIPGLGRILLTSINNRDYPVVQAIIVIIAVWVIGINFVVDMIYRVIDPRID